MLTGKKLMPATVMAALLVGGCQVSPIPSPDSQRRTESGPLVLGHRGASGYRPEHTLAAYALAIEQGADYIEPDLVVTADGVLVARHENAIGGTTDVAMHPEFADRKTTKTIDGRAFTDWFVEDFTLAELKTLRAIERLPRLRPDNTAFNGQFSIPTLEEIIALVRERSEGRAAGVGLYIEIKHSTYFRGIGKPIEEALVAVLRAAKLDRHDAPVIIQSFETANLRRLRALTPVRLFQLIDDQGAPFDFVAAGIPRTYADLVTPAGLREIATYADGIGAAKELIIPRTAAGNMGAATRLVEEAHQAGLAVHAWTFRAENAFLPSEMRSGGKDQDKGNLLQEISEYLRTGVDGVFSDNPDIAVAARRAIKGRGGS